MLIQYSKEEATRELKDGEIMLILNTREKRKIIYLFPLNEFNLVALNSIAKELKEISVISVFIRVQFPQVRESIELFEFYYDNVILFRPVDSFIRNALYAASRDTRAQSQKIGWKLIDLYGNTCC